MATSEFASTTLATVFVEIHSFAPTLAITVTMSAAVASSPAHGHPFDQELDQPMEEEFVEGQSYLESDRSVDISENQWREITQVYLLTAPDRAGKLTDSKILKDVLPTMSPEEELGDLAAAEAAVNAKVAQRDAMVNKMRDELRSE